MGKDLALLIVLTIVSVMFFNETTSKNSFIRWIKEDLLIPYKDASRFIKVIYPYIFFGGWWLIVIAVFK